MLLLDELCCGGSLLETDPGLLVERVLMKEGRELHDGKASLGDMTIGQAIKQAKDQIIANMNN